MNHPKRRLAPYKRGAIPAAKPYRVLLPLSNLNEARLLLPLTEMLVAERRGQLVILIVATVPEGRPLSKAAAQASRLRKNLFELFGSQFAVAAQIETTVRPRSEVWSAIWQVVESDQIDLLVLGWANSVMPITAVGEIAEPRLANPPCDVIAVRPARMIAKGPEWQAARRILAPVRGGPNMALILRVAHTFAKHNDGRISLLHVTSEDSRGEKEQFLDEFGPALDNLERVTRSVTAKGDIPQRIVKEARDHQLVVMGAPTTTSLPGVWSDALINEVIANTQASVILVKQRAPRIVLPLKHSGPEVRSVDRPVSVVVDQWFAENTFHSREFADLDQLLLLKEQRKITISLGLPALNEENTVGNVIQTVKKALMDDVPLLDEIILIDSGSVDYTREIAADLGIPVYIHHEILPQYGSYHGKGEALWKSLYVLNGDIIAWIDTDIKNIHPRFVYGILGPLLRNPNIQYIKGFYRRPLREGDKLIAGGGGRVTELTARPFFNLYYPELSGLIQPLAGEYAGRRQTLQDLPFFTGYGVETGLLIDMLEAYGLWAIAQVDLLERVHHNQPLPSLSKMSFTIMQVVAKRLGRRHNVELLDQANLTLNRILYEPRRYYLQPEEIVERERPPMITLPEYCEKFGLPPTAQAKKDEVMRNRSPRGGQTFTEMEAE